MVGCDSDAGDVVNGLWLNGCSSIPIPSWSNSASSSEVIPSPNPFLEPFCSCPKQGLIGEAVGEAHDMVVAGDSSGIRVLMGDQVEPASSGVEGEFRDADTWRSGVGDRSML